MILDEIIKIPILENLNIECKSRLNRENPEGWLKTIAGFSNADGGSFFIGVEDKSNKLIGFTRKDADENHKPYIFSSSDHFTLVLPDLTYSSGIKNDRLHTIDISPSPPISEYDEKILSYCYTSIRKASEISSFLGISDSSYLRTKILEPLVNSEFLIPEKQGNAKAYRTNIKKVKL